MKLVFTAGAGRAQRSRRSDSRDHFREVVKAMVMACWRLGVPICGVSREAAALCSVLALLALPAWLRSEGWPL